MGDAPQSPRRCRGWGSLLARDNADGRCVKCLRGTRGGANRPPLTPAGFWDEPTLRAALTDQHMGRVIAAYRRHHAHPTPLRQADIAAWADLSQARLSRLETGPPIKHLDDLAFWARLLDIPARLLWFQLPGNPHLALSPRPHAPGPVSGERYRLLRFDEDLPPDEADIAAMRTFREADRSHGGGHLYSEVLDYWNTRLAPRLFSGDDDPAPTVFVAAAALVEMAGWMALDAGRDDQADRQFRRALELSRLGRDRQLTIHIHASRAHLELHRGAPGNAIRHAYDAEMTLSKSPPNPELTARVLAMQARGFAALGQAPHARKLLERAEHALHTGTPLTVSAWVSRFDHGSLASDTARTLRQLGDLTGAATAAQHIIDLRPPERARSRALGQLTLATVLTDQGHPDHACAIATDVLHTTADLASYLVIHRLGDLRARLMRYYTSAPVIAFLDLIDHALSLKTWIPAPARLPNPTLR